ncbi:MAG TPA: DUF3352 domain-containing protein [Kribbella sp.]|nr:DUF3352 domain-containing protein [Kribbella sp.]
MSDYTNPPAGEHHRGASGGPQGPNGGPPQQNPYGPPAQQNPYGGRPGQQGGPVQPGQGQPGYQPQEPNYPANVQGGQPTGQAGQPGPQYGQPGQDGPSAQQGPGAVWPQPGQPGSPDQLYGGQPPYGGPPEGFTQSEQWQQEPKRRGKLIPLIAALAVLIVLAGGGVFAYGRLNGGGDQPAAVLPGNAIAYARVDLNPSAGQRVAALRFMMKFPSVKDGIGLTGDNDDLRQKLFELIKKDAGEDLADVDFDKDVKPWLGDRFGIAALPGKKGDEPSAVVAVEVKDQDKAKAGLDRLFADEKDKPGVAFTGKYAIIAEDQAQVDAAVAASKDSPLEDNPTFDADMSALGEQGVASFWADTQALADLSGDKLTDDQRKILPTGSAAAALRFDSQYVELKGVVHGDKTFKAGAANAADVVSTLPDSTAGALAISDGATLVGTIWEQLQKSTAGTGIELGDLTKDFTEQYGITLPDDLKPLFGKNFVVAVDSDDDDGPKIAARMETDPAKAEEVVDKVSDLIRNQTSADIPIKKAKDGDTLVIATDKAYADQVLKGGNLGQTESFKQALPDTEGAVMLGYVNFEAAGSLTDELSDNKDLTALRSAGYVIRVKGEGEADFTLRVVAK